MYDFSRMILDSLITAHLLADEIESVQVFDRFRFRLPTDFGALNFDQKLGHLYEDAMRVLIEASPSLDLVADHVQIFDENKRTIGELDFIIYDRERQAYVHLEMAVKFYMGVYKHGEWLFPGPNATDSWQRKLERMRSHQFQLLARADTKALLSERFNITDIHTQQLIYGRLFYPWEYGEVITPECIAVDARKGRWVYARDLDQALPDSDQFYVLPKPLWPIVVRDQICERLDAISVQTLISMAQQRCIMFVDRNDDHAVWFVAPNTWASDL